MPVESSSWNGAATVKPGMIFYTGPSMNPTLKAKDVLRLVSSQDATIRTGDVIVFRSPQGGENVVHRVVSVDAGGCVRTRGDSNPAADPWLLTRGEIKGRVTHALNGNRLRRVRGGSMGMLIHLLLRGRRTALRPFLGFARVAYRWLARTGLVRRMVRNRTDVRVVSFRRPDGSDELQLLLGNRLIGMLRPGQLEWHISPPFRLVVDEASLPRIVSPQ